MVENHFCPVCKQNRNNLVLNSCHYFYCTQCKLVFNANYQVLKYDNNYFLEDYKNQYNKTYADDYSHIIKISQIRLKRINKIWKKMYKFAPSSLLDIGAALGFFMKAAVDYGFKMVEGVEISKYAADYCKINFGFYVENTPFQKAKISKQFDVITGWYFLEHCDDPLSVLFKIRSSLNEKAVVAFALPSIFGPLYRKHIARWIKSHPLDHRVDFSPSSIKKLLLKSGFKSVKVYPAAFHPERVLSRKNIFFPIFKIFYKIYAKIKNYSDTMEVYAVR